MYVLKAIGECISNGELVKHEIYITAPSANECFDELARYKDSSYMFIKVDSLYIA